MACARSASIFFCPRTRAVLFFRELDRVALRDVAVVAAVSPALTLCFVLEPDEVAVFAAGACVAAGSPDFLALVVNVCALAAGRTHAITQALMMALNHPARIGIRCLKLTTSPNIPANKQAQPGSWHRNHLPLQERVPVPIGLV
jgi:hypothetical protein